MMNAYADHLIDLYKHPLHQGFLNDASVTQRSFNPLCGDDITVDLFIEKGLLKAARHRGVGCVISQASVSLLLDHALGKSVEEVLSLKKEHVQELLGLELGPVRLKCALLGLEALQEAIKKYSSPSS